MEDQEKKPPFVMQFITGRTLQFRFEEETGLLWLIASVENTHPLIQRDTQIELALTKETCKGLILALPHLENLLHKVQKGPVPPKFYQ